MHASDRGDDTGDSDDDDYSMVDLGGQDGISEYEDENSGNDKGCISGREEQLNGKKGKRKKGDSRQKETESRERGGSEVEVVWPPRKRGKYAPKETAKKSRRKKSWVCRYFDPREVKGANRVY